jgi:hypothetical protein
MGSGAGQAGWKPWLEPPIHIFGIPNGSLIRIPMLHGSNASFEQGR